jgi:hypothetical protein
MASCPVRRRRKAKESQQPQLVLSDDLLDEIFFRAGSHLVRASTACVAFRFPPPASSPAPPSSAATCT